MREAGRAVADGWELAHREAELGAGSLVRDLFRREGVSQSRPPRPAAAVALAPPAAAAAAAAAVRPRSVPGGANGRSHSLLARFFGPSWPRFSPPPGRDQECMAHWTTRLEKLCERTELATIKGVVHTWPGSWTVLA